MGAAGTLLGVLAYVRAGKVRRECAQRARDAGLLPEGSVDPHAIRDVAMLRYDAFRDMGGRLSFSLALLDTTGDGVVLTSINAHSETRTYAKVIRHGQSTHDLSPEERQVLAQARDGKADHPSYQSPYRGADGASRGGTRQQDDVRSGDTRAR